MQTNLPMLLALGAAWLLGTAAPAFAEAPMATDDASTLDRGNMKIEAVWNRDARTRGGELLYGLSPIDGIELEIAATRAVDRANPSGKLQGTGLGIKWVPIRNDSGWSLGARFDHGRTRVPDYAHAKQLVEKEYALTGLATLRHEDGPALHLNLGTMHTHTPYGGHGVGTWGVGGELPLAARVQATAEIFGTQHARPDKAVGLRYAVIDGLKISAAVGRGNGHGFGQVGFAWEF